MVSVVWILLAWLCWLWKVVLLMINAIVGGDCAVLAGEGSWRNEVYTIAWMGWMAVVVEEKM